MDYIATLIPAAAVLISVLLAPQAAQTTKMERIRNPWTCDAWHTKRCPMMNQEHKNFFHMLDIKNSNAKINTLKGQINMVNKATIVTLKVFIIIIWSLGNRFKKVNKKINVSFMKSFSYKRMPIKGFRKKKKKETFFNVNVKLYWENTNWSAREMRKNKMSQMESRPPVQPLLFPSNLLL